MRQETRNPFVLPLTGVKVNPTQHTTEIELIMYLGFAASIWINDVFLGTAFGKYGPLRTPDNKR